MSGTVGQAFAAGIEYQWLERDDAVVLAASWRADQRNEPTTTTPDPDTLRAHDWNLPNEGDRVALALWLHEGRGGDVALALSFIETIVEGIPDIAERNCARGIEWDNAQAEAVRLVREHIEDIRDLARLLCERGGRMTAGEVQAFFDCRTPRARA